MTANRLLLSSVLVCKTTKHLARQSIHLSPSTPVVSFRSIPYSESLLTSLHLSEPHLVQIPTTEAEDDLPPFLVQASTLFDPPRRRVHLDTYSIRVTQSRQERQRRRASQPASQTNEDSLSRRKSTGRRIGGEKE